MSFKAKNLQYSAPEAPFLKGLRGEYQDSDVPRTSVYGRAKGSRIKTDEDDGPLIIDEEGNEVSKEDMARREEGSDEQDKTGLRDEDEKPSVDTEDQKEKKDATTVGASRKRKMGKMVGGDEDGMGEKEGARKEGLKEDKAGKKKSNKKKAKKAVGLSFDDEG